MSSVRQGVMGGSPYRQSARTEQPAKRRPTPGEEWRLLVNRDQWRRSTRPSALIASVLFLAFSIASAFATTCPRCEARAELLLRGLLPAFFLLSFVELFLKRRYARKLEASGVSIPDHLRP